MRKVGTERKIIDVEKRRGPRIEPWGTPHVMLEGGDDLPLNTTNCFLSDK